MKRVLNKLLGVQKICISKLSNPLQYWYSLDYGIASKPSVRRYKRDERFVTHGMPTSSIVFQRFAATGFVIG